MKRCPKCGEVKPYSDFAKDSRKLGGVRWLCLVCQREMNRERRCYWKSNIEYRYGMNNEAYAAMLRAQNGKCLICGADELDKRTKHPYSLAVDHDHVTGEIRGLLCRACNRGLGFFQDSPALLARAIEYLNRSRSASDCSA